MARCGSRVKRRWSGLRRSDCRCGGAEGILRPDEVMKMVISDSHRLGGAARRRITTLVLVGLSGLGANCNGDDPTSGELKPFADEWRVEFTAPFPYVGPDNSPQIENLQIGGREIDENFANRGDVIVLFDRAQQSPATATITVEMRRYTMAPDEDAAQDDFAALDVVATTGDPTRGMTDPADDCSQAWRDECSIRVYFAGLSQLQRSGADLRVTLPWFYRHNVDIVTSDNLADSDYTRRSNVCVDGLNASVNVELGSGEAFVKLAPEATPMPQCEFLPDALMECIDPDDGVAWQPDCGCITQIGTFGQVEVVSLDAAAANLTVDTPAGLWSVIALRNEKAGQTRGTDPNCNDASDPGVRCDACVADVDQFTIDPSVGTEETRAPWQLLGSIAVPNDEAVPNSGFGMRLSSKSCDPVAYTSSPDEFVGKNQGSTQPIEERGNLLVCTGCLADQTCDALLEPS